MEELVIKTKNNTSLSILFTSKKRKNIIEENINILKKERNLLKQKLIQSQKKLNIEIEKGINLIEQEWINLLVHKTIMNMLLKKGVYDNILSEKEKKIIEFESRFTINDLKMYSIKKEEIFKKLNAINLSTASFELSFEDIQKVYNEVLGLQNQF